MFESVSRVLTANGGLFNHIPVLEDPLHRFFVQAIFIIAICRGLALIAYPLKQPSVIWEIIGGVLMGPSAFGRNEYYLEVMFPKSSLANLQLVANIGLVLYLFIVGMELDPKLLVSHARKAGGIAIIGMAVPFALGIAISHTLYNVLESKEPGFEHVPARSFYIFVGTAMSITAFPVLARILKESGLIYTKPGSLAMGAAALNDAVAWCLLILAISIAKAGDMAVAGKVFGCVFAVGFGLFAFVRIPYEKFVNYIESLNNKALDSHLFAASICVCFLCAWITGLLGVDTIFGAFMFGLIVPRGTRLFHACNEYIENFVLCVTLPLYFALSGLKTDVTQIHTGEDGGMLILVCTVASFGKFIGAGGTALLTGVPMREAATIAALMNTRGLVELIVLNLGLSAGILNIRTFSVMVLMALFTTFTTCPMIALIYPPKYRTRLVDEEVAKPDKLKGVSSAEDFGSLNGDNLTHRISKDTRIALVVDRLEHLQGLIKIIGCFLPFQPDSGLAVTAIHLIEPTKSTQDEFLALNDHGRLLRVDEETTDMVVALRDAADPALKKPDLLPLSMFCRGMDTPVNAFRIQGDPDEFPLEIKTLAKHNECSMVMMPWRESVYVQKLFWATKSLNTNNPVVLIVRRDAEPRTRHRSDSQTRVRSQSLYMFQSLFTDHEEGPHTPEPAVAGGANNTLYSSAVVASGRRPTICATMPKLAHSHRLNRVIVAVLTGSLADVAVLSILLRFVENKSNVIYCLIPKDFEVFDPLIETALTSYRRLTESMEHVHNNVVEAISTDSSGLINISITHDLDYFLCGFVEPHRRDSDAHHQSAPEAPVSMDDDQSSDDAGEKEGIPKRYQDTHLKHPELGELGYRFYRAALHKACKMLVVHHDSGLVNKGLDASARETKSELPSSAAAAGAGEGEGSVVKKLFEMGDEV